VPLLDRKPGQLSGGQRQRAAIGRALVRDVGVFLFDEPLSNLDAKLRTEMRSEIRRLHDTLGVTSVYVTHDQVEAMTMATRIAVMKGGVVQQLGTPQDLYDHPANLFVAGFIGTTAMNLLPGTIEGGPGAWIARCGDAHLPLADYPFAQAPRAGASISVGLRPETLPAGPGDAAVPGLAGEVDQVEPMGADSLVWLRWNGQRLALRTTPARALSLRGTVPLALDAQHLSVFDPQTQQRL
jgi:multiple sugar transport system ATP-binding protein